MQRAARRLRVQREDLDRQAVALEAANRELHIVQRRLRTHERLASIFTEADGTNEPSLTPWAFGAAEARLVVETVSI